MSEAQFGELSFFRDLFRLGEVRHRTLQHRPPQHGKDRADLPAQRQEPHERARRLDAGDIGAVVKLKDTHTGNTLCSAETPVSLPKVEYPKPNIHAALQSSAKGEEDKIASGLAALHHEDPTFLHHGRFGAAPDRSFPRKASCTWKSSPIGCAAVTMSMSN